MNGKRKISSALLFLLVVFAAVALTVAADGIVSYPGYVNAANDLLENAKAATAPAQMDAALDAVYEYLSMKPINPDSEGYDELMAGIEKQNLVCAELYYEASIVDGIKAIDKEVALDGVAKYLALPHDNTGDDYAEFVANVNKENLACAKLYYEASVAATTASAKNTAINGIEKFLGYPHDKDGEGYAEFIANFEKEKYACAKLLLNDLNIAVGTAKNGIAVRKINAFLKAHPLSREDSEYETFMTSYNKKIAEHNAAIEAAKEAAERLALVSDYQYSPLTYLGFDGAETDVGVIKGEYGTSSDNVGTGSIKIDSGKDGDNGYYIVLYDVDKTHYRTSLPISYSDDGVVIEFDYTVFDNPVNATVNVEHGGITTPNGPIYPGYFQITKDGNIVITTTKETVLKGAIVPGEWVHFSIVIDEKTNEAKVYVDYELMATFQSENNSYGENYKPANVRIGTSGASKGTAFALDNFRIYQGSSIRSFDKLSKMSEDEQFIFFCSVVNDDKLPLENRTVAYDMATEVLSKYWDGEKYLSSNSDLRAAVDQYIGFDYKEALAILYAENLKEYLKLCNVLFAYERKPSTLASRTAALLAVDKFVITCNDQIEKNTEYALAQGRVEQIRVEIEVENNVVNFTNEVDTFYNTSGVKTLQAAYDKATAYLAGCDMLLVENKEFVAFADAYERYLGCEKVIYDAISIDNSKKVIACITFISDYDTEEEWVESYDYLAPYVTTIRGILLSGHYDSFYPGMEDALESFSGLNAYVYGLIQEGHIEYITAALERCKNSSVYFEKYGVCRQVLNYVEANEIDYTNEELVALINEVKALEETLRNDESSYMELLKENTGKFIELCKGLVGNISYTEMKKICDEAIVYYFAMDVDSADAISAVELFVTRRAELESVEAVAQGFIDSVNALVATHIDSRLGLFSECYSYLEHLELEYEGVKEAVEAYEKAVESYNAYISNANSDVNSICEYVCYMGNNSAIETLTNKLIETLSK